MTEAKMNDGPARVLENEEILPGIFRILLLSPDTAAEARPGEFVQIESSPGTFPVTRRPFTLNRCSPSRGTVEIVLDVVGRGTDLLSRMEPGESPRLLGPLGRGYRTGEGRWLLVGGGMGAAGFPFLGDAVDVAVTCIGAAGAGKVLPGSPGEVRIATEDGSAGRKGLVTVLLDDIPWDGITDVAVCGSPAMMNAVWGMIPGTHRDRVQVSTESRMGCGWGVCEGCVIPAMDSTYVKCCTEGPVFDAREIDWDRWIEVTGS
jgi:dihydroorotate dehydrogenase electron transfer subunit